MVTDLDLKRILVRTRLLERPVYRLKRSRAYNLARFGLWTDRYLPEVVYIETTNACNAVCYSCPRQKMQRPVGTMSWDLFRKIVADLKPLGGLGLFVCLHLDGEPLLDPLLFERIRYLKAELKNVRVHFNTNAALLTEEKARAVLASGLTSIAFSVDGTSPETYGHVKTGLRYERTVENVRRFLALRQEAGGRRPHVTMQMVVTDVNRHEVAEYRRLWSGLVDEVFIKAMLNFLVQGTSIKTGALADRQLRRCFQPVSLTAVYQDGRVGLCCWDYDHLAELGSVVDRNLLDIFNDEAHRRVRAAMLAMDCRDVAPCNICSQIYGHDMDSDY